MSDRQIPVALVYDHPGVNGTTRYEQYLDADAIGAVILVLDALADVSDPDEIQRVAERVAEAVSG